MSDIEVRHKREENKIYKIEDLFCNKIIKSKLDKKSDGGKNQSIRNILFIRKCISYEQEIFYPYILFLKYLVILFRVYLSEENLLSRSSCKILHNWI